MSQRRPITGKSDPENEVTIPTLTLPAVRIIIYAAEEIFDWRSTPDRGAPA